MTSLLYGQSETVSDSLAAIHFLSKRSPDYNISLYNAVVEAAVLLPHPPILNWVPSHVGLVGNEIADRAAARATHQPDPDIHCF